MKIKVIRRWYSRRATLGELYLDGEFFCHTLEDKDRRLEQAADVGQMMARKIPGETCIPRGKYNLGITFSNRFQKYTPELHDVPCFEYIRIHPGNTHENTEGCILVGEQGEHEGEVCVWNSRITFNHLMDKLEAALDKGEGLEIEIA